MVVGGTGSYGNGGGYYDIYLLKVNNQGNILWTKTFGGNDDEFFSDAIATDDGGYLLLSESYSFVTTGFIDAYVVKTDSSGNMEWSGNYGIPGTYENALSVCSGGDGGYLFAGYAVESGARKIMLFKTNAQGEVLWGKLLYCAPPKVTAEAAYVKPAADGGYIIAGGVYDSVKSNRDVLLVKTDSSGTVQWAKGYGSKSADGPWSFTDDEAVIQAGDGGYVVTTHTEDAGNPDVYLIKTDAAGNLQWSKAYGGAELEGGADIQITPDGGYIVAGATTTFTVDPSDTYLLRLKSNGDTVWTKRYGGTNHEPVKHLALTNDKGYITCGSLTNQSGTASNIYLIKTDSNGYSGCNESSTPTIVTVPNTLQYDVILIESAATVYMDTPATVVGSGGMDSTLCYDSLTAIGEPGAVSTGFGVEIYPNPFSEKVIINIEYLIFDQEKELQFILYDVLGREVLSSGLRAPRSELTRNGLPDGIYFYELRSKRQMLATGKLVVQD